MEVSGLAMATKGIGVDLFLPLLCPRAGLLTFEAPSDVEEAIRIQTAHVTRVEPAFRVDGLTRFVLHVQIAHEDGAAPEADLTDAVGILIHQLHPAARDQLARAGDEGDKGGERSGSASAGALWDLQLHGLHWWQGSPLRIAF